MTNQYRSSATSRPFEAVIEMDGVDQRSGPIVRPSKVAKFGDTRCPRSTPASEVADGGLERVATDR